MRTFVTLSVLFLYAASMGFLSGCVNKSVKDEKSLKKSPVERVIINAPDWVNKGSRYSANQDARLFYGVSSAAFSGDLAQQKSLSDDGARAKVLLLLSYYLDGFNLFYRDSRQPELSEVPAGSIQPWINDMLKLNLSSVRIIGSWREASSNTVWSMAELDLESVKSAMADTQNVDADLKVAFQANAEKIFDRIVKESQK